MRKPAPAIRRLKDRVLLMLGRAIVTLVNDATMIQSVQLEGLPDEILDDVERLQNYGFSSRPHPGSEALFAAMGGQRQHPVVFVVDDRRHRIRELEEGEAAIYTSENRDDSPHRVHLKQGRITEMHAGASSIVMTPTEIRLRSGGGAWITLTASIAGDGTNVDWG